MVRYKVIWTETAREQLYEILEYWTNRNKSQNYAIKILSLVDEYIAFIESQPESFRKTRFNNNRICIIGSYSIFFKIVDDLIIITCFWDNRQDPSSLNEQLEK